MSTTSDPDKTSPAFKGLENDELPPAPSLLTRAWTFVKKQPLGSAGLMLVIIFVIMAIFADVLTTHDPESGEFFDQFTRPYSNSDATGAYFLLGADEFGRDVFTRIVYGARTALFVGIVCAVLGAFVGLVLGVASAYFGGWTDTIMQRLMDILMAFPLIILALTIVIASRAVLQVLDVQNPNDYSIYFVIIAITIPFIPKCARVVRSSALAIREIPFVDAARANGFSHSRIIMRHMVPNVMAPFLIMLTAFVGQAILLEASLSFLGLGVQEPTPAWGLMLRSSQEFIREEAFLAIYPGLAITLAVFGFNLFGDAVRDALDPKLRSQN
ncbi:MAG: ABC transporter permease [Pseudomonadota bacterium]